MGPQWSSTHFETEIFSTYGGGIDGSGIFLITKVDINSKKFIFQSNYLSNVVL